MGLYFWPRWEYREHLPSYLKQLGKTNKQNIQDKSLQKSDNIQCRTVTPEKGGPSELSCMIFPADWRRSCQAITQGREPRQRQPRRLLGSRRLNWEFREIKMARVHS